MNSADLERRVLDALREFVCVAVAQRLDAAAPTAAPALPLARIHQKLLNAATTTPTPTKALIRQAGYPVSSYSRQAVTELCRRGLLARVPEGIRLP